MRRSFLLVPTVAMLIASVACTPTRAELAKAHAEHQAKQAAQPPAKPSAIQILTQIDANDAGPTIVRRQDLIGPPSIVLPSTITGLRLVWHADRPLMIVDDGYNAEEQAVITKMSAMTAFGATPVVSAAGPGVADLHVLLKRVDKDYWRLKTIATDAEATAVIASWYTDVWVNHTDSIPVAMQGWNSWFVQRDTSMYATTRLMRTKAASPLNDQVVTFESAYKASTADPAAASATFAAAIDTSDGAASYAAGYNALLLAFIASGKPDDAMARALASKHIGSGKWTQEGWDHIIAYNVKRAIDSHVPPRPVPGVPNAISAAIHLVPGRVEAATPDGGIVRVAVKHSFQTRPGEFLGSWPADEAMPRCSAVSTVEVTNTSKNMVTLRQLGVFDQNGRPLEARIDTRTSVDGTGALVLAPNASVSIQVTFLLANQTAQTTAVQIGSISGIPTAVDGTGSPTATTMLPITIGPPKRVPYSHYK